MNKWPCQDYKSMVDFYGPVGENQTSLVIPYPMLLAWDTSVVVKKITCHEKVKDSLERILYLTLKEYGISDIKKLNLNIFGGCINVRKMRGGSSWSIHSWGCAIDLSPDLNDMKMGRSTAQFAKKEYDPFWEIVEDEGWVSLGRSKNFDFMHAQAANLC